MHLPKSSLTHSEHILNVATKKVFCFQFKVNSYSLKVSFYRVTCDIEALKANKSVNFEDIKRKFLEFLQCRH